MCPAAAHHHGIHGGHGKHGMWGMGSTLVVVDKKRGESVDGSEAEQLLGGSPGSALTFGGAREKVRPVQGWICGGYCWAVIMLLGWGARRRMAGIRCMVPCFVKGTKCACLGSCANRFFWQP